MRIREESTIRDILRHTPAWTRSPAGPAGGWWSRRGRGAGTGTTAPTAAASVHLDDRPGDRGSDCHGRMEPIGVWVRKNGEWAIIHRCVICGKMSSNRTAADDNPMKLMAFAMRPFGSLAVSGEYVKNMVASMEDRTEG